MEMIQHLLVGCATYGLCLTAIVACIGLPIVCAYTRRLALTLEHVALLWHGPTACRNYVPKASR